ncbi:MAG: ABC transporter ATP-binding protein [Cytophagales bacterium]|nr:ABC transporter ATP-binding protein [Cytophagales bacterium]
MPDSQIALSVSDLSKGFKRDRKNTFWALQTLNFEIQKGDFVGIVGHNGSGKSTLLRLLADLSQPTTGTIKRTGKVAALLDIGHGFHPDLSGWENIFLSGKLQGLNTTYIHSRIHDILSFSGIGDFVHQPVREYSQGMFLRLALSVALHVEASIFLLDEVLSVGDAAFQWRCQQAFQRLRDEKKTVLVVSHQAHEIWDKCDHYMVLERGRILSFRPEPSGLIDYARKSWLQHVDHIAKGSAHIQGMSRIVNIDQSLKDLPVKIESCWCHPIGKGLNAPFLAGDSLSINLKLEVLDVLREVPEVVYHIHDFSGHVITSLSTYFHGKVSGLRSVNTFPTKIEFSCKAPQGRLNHGFYFISLFLIHRQEEKLLFKGQYILNFEVGQHKEKLVRATCEGGLSVLSTWNLSLCKSHKKSTQNVLE